MHNPIYPFCLLPGSRDVTICHPGRIKERRGGFLAPSIFINGIALRRGAKLLVNDVGIWNTDYVRGIFFFFSFFFCFINLNLSFEFDICDRSWKPESGER